MPSLVRCPPPLVVAVFLFATLAISSAHGETADPDRDAGPAATVDAFHEALAGGDREAVLAFLTDDVVVFESGGAEMSADEYAHHHLASDMEFSAAVERTLVDRKVRRHEGSATVLTRSELRGTFRDREIALRSAETMVLVEGDGGWRIAHIHWSSRSSPEE